jgi:hypothetical protein
MNEAGGLRAGAAGFETLVANMPEDGLSHL